jgi:hypothetical protein
MTESERADQLCVDWGNRILMFEGLVGNGWSINFTPSRPGFGAEGLAIQKDKEIIIHWPTGKPHYPLMLHEIAHAIGGSGHDSEVFHQFQGLVEKYMKPLTAEDISRGAPQS